MKLKAVLKWALIAFVVWWVIQQPGNASHLIHNVGSLLAEAASGFSRFITSI